MPPLAIVDSHVHLWDPTRFRMPWLDGNGILNRPFSRADLREQSSGVEIEQIVYLEVDIPPVYKFLEARWVAGLPEESPPIGAIVASAPLEYGDRARAFLEAVVQVDRRVRGIRRLIQDEPDPAFCVQPEFVRGVQALADYGLSFDICVRHPQLASAVALVRQCPSVSFVLDHIGKPNIRDGLLDPWREQIRQLAALPNVACKLSGMATEADHQRWTIQDLAPYAEHILECFGDDRVMFGGDWPVVLMASSYRRWVETVEQLTAGLSDDAKRKLWRDNARRFYRLDAPRS